MNKFQQLKGYLGQTEWNPPIITSDDIHDEHEDKMIFTGREMVNAMELKGKEYLSKQGRYFPAGAFYERGPLEFLKGRPTEWATHPKTGEKVPIAWEEIPIKPGTKHYYPGHSEGTLGRIPRKPRPPIVHALNRIQKANTIQSLRDTNMQLDLKMYQALLADPATNQRAIEELRELQGIILDTGKVAEAELEEKLKRTKMFASGVGLIGTVLGAASGIASVGAIAERASNVATGTAQQALKLTESITDKLGKANALAGAVGMIAAAQGIKTQRNINRNKLAKINTNTKKLALKTAYAVAMKTAGLTLLGVAASLNPVGGTITAIAIVTTVAKGALNIKVKQIEKKEMALKMGKEDLMKAIDEMIQNNGTIFYKEDNPMFRNGLILKEQVDSILNTKEVDQVHNAVMALENSARAVSLLDDMITNAGNATRNAAFELELEKSKTMEKMNNATLKRLRNRRSKLKQLYTEYKKPMIDRNIKNMMNESAVQRGITSLTNSWNSVASTPSGSAAGPNAAYSASRGPALRKRRVTRKLRR